MNMRDSSQLNDRVWELTDFERLRIRHYVTSEVKVNSRHLKRLSFSSLAASCCRALSSSCCTAEWSNPAWELYRPRLTEYILRIPTIVLAEVSTSLFTLSDQQLLLKIAAPRSNAGNRHRGSLANDYSARQWPRGVAVTCLSVCLSTFWTSPDKKHMTWALAYSEKQLGFRTSYSNARQISHHSYKIKTTYFQNTPSFGVNKCEFMQNCHFCSFRGKATTRCIFFHRNHQL